MDKKDYFVRKSSIVRKIWGKSDTILLIFAGAAAEFALNKAVDWLYFTGKLPADPLGRLFTTVEYARNIVFSETPDAIRTIDALNDVHRQVEEKRGLQIPDWAYRDVLFLLIDYSIRSFEVLERKLNDSEKQEVLDVFNKLGYRMGLKELPVTFRNWQVKRSEHLARHLGCSKYTVDLFRQYKKHLGSVRYKLLIESQALVLPRHVRELLGLKNYSLLRPFILPYRVIRSLRLDWIVKDIFLPSAYKSEIRELDVRPA